MISVEQTPATERKNRISAIEKIFIKTGDIVAVRRWDGGTQHELDIHLPNVNFDKWTTAQKIKCRISSLHFADYTPAMWNGIEKICTLYIDTGHNGQGSQWAKAQQPGNLFHYFNLESAKHYPAPNKHLVFLGDQSAIGHFCALQQLVSDESIISGFISVRNQETAAAFEENCPWLPLQAVTGNDTIHQQTEEWILQQSEIDNYAFYIAGNAHLVVKLRKMLKLYGVEGSAVKSEGFWH